MIAEVLESLKKNPEIKVDIKKVDTIIEEANEHLEVIIRKLTFSL